MWLGYKLHISETCDDPPACGCPPPPAAAGRCGHDVRPNLITHVATTDATVSDTAMTIPVSAALARRHLAPARHYLDSGYASARNMLEAARLSGTILVTPLLADNSPQARAGEGYDQSAFAIDYDARTVTCPQGATSASWTPTRLRGHDVISVRFRVTTCRPCPVRQLCTTATRTGRQLTIPPRELHDVITRARAGQTAQQWRDDYKRRAGAEATISQAITTTGSRRTRYRGLARTRLEHAYLAWIHRRIAVDHFRSGLWPGEFPGVIAGVGVPPPALLRPCGDLSAPGTVAVVAVRAVGGRGDRVWAGQAARAGGGPQAASNRLCQPASQCQYSGRCKVR